MQCTLALIYHSWVNFVRSNGLISDGFDGAAAAATGIRPLRATPSETPSAAETPPRGSVALVGSGPGDPDLLTLQAHKLLKGASLVVADRLVSKEILDLIDCELKVANKRPGCAEVAQAELNRWVVEAVQAGETVVRLKIGDPLLFGRGAEEILEYKKHGIEATVCPGLSSAYTAPLYARIPITHRGVANQVVICTGYGRDASVVDAPEYRKEQTVVLLMAVGRIADIAQAMIAQHHYPPATPVAIIERATTPQQRVLYGQLHDIGAVAVAQNAQPPATIVVGNVVSVLSEI